MQKQTRCSPDVAFVFRNAERMKIANEQEALEEALKEIEEALRSHDFLSQRSEPHLGDLAIYGALRAIEGLPAHERILGHESPDRPLKDWYARTRNKVTGA